MKEKRLVCWNQNYGLENNVKEKTREVYISKINILFCENFS